MNSFEYISSIRNQIEKDNLDDALKSLGKLLSSSPRLDELIMQSGRFAALKQQIRNGILDFNIATIERNKIRYSLLEFIRDIESSIDNNLEVQDEINKHISNIKQFHSGSGDNVGGNKVVNIHAINQKVFLLTLGIIAILSIFWYFRNKQLEKTNFKIVSHIEDSDSISTIPLDNMILVKEEHNNNEPTYFVDNNLQNKNTNLKSQYGTKETKILATDPFTSPAQQKIAPLIVSKDNDQNDFIENKIDSQSQNNFNDTPINQSNPILSNGENKGKDSTKQASYTIGNNNVIVKSNTDPISLGKIANKETPHKLKKKNFGYPIHTFSLLNGNDFPLIISEIKLEIVCEEEECWKGAKTREISPVAVWDINLPNETGNYTNTYKPKKPILISSQDAASISVRFNYNGRPPRNNCRIWTARIIFYTDKSEIFAISDSFYI